MSVTTAGIMNLDILTFVFQIVNSLILVGIIYFLYYIIFKWPKENKILNKRIETIENEIKEINKKL